MQLLCDALQVLGKPYLAVDQVISIATLHKDGSQNRHYDYSSYHQKQNAHALPTPQLSFCSWLSHEPTCLDARHSSELQKPNPGN